jgi:hypothetical protein
MVMPLPRLSTRIVVALATIAALAPASFAQSGGPYELRSSTIDGGGVTAAAGGAYQVGATVGQPDAGAASGGSYLLSGGFWVGISGVAASTPTPTVTGTVPATPTATAPPSPTQTATALPTAPGTPASTPTFSPTTTPTATASATANTTPTPTPSVTPTPLARVGDCNGNGTVTVDEILTGVRIALGTAQLDQCRRFDGNNDQQVTIDEILVAINNALNGR